MSDFWPVKRDIGESKRGYQGMGPPRLKLVGDIWDSIAADAPRSVELAEAQRRELRRRLAEHDADPGSAIPWSQVRDELLPRDE